LKIVFFGASDFAISSLRSLADAAKAPALVVTKPDAVRGRGRKIHPAEVKLAAEELGLKVQQPEDPSAPEFQAVLQKSAPDLFVVVSYGRIFPEDFLAIPAKGSLNVHASLLPRHRGAAPVQSAILAGDAETGVTIMRMNARLDAGDILLTRKTPIEPGENAGQLRERLAELGGKALVEALDLVASGKARFKKQDEKLATVAGKIQKADGVIHWDRPAIEIERFVRAMTPAPGAQTRLGMRRFIVMQGDIETDGYGLGIPGGVLSAGEEGIRVCTGDGIYRIVRIKPENGRNMTAGEFVRGHPIYPNARFG
jgi:methionyl-tRNA formyltransferase